MRERERERENGREKGRKGSMSYKLYCRSRDATYGLSVYMW